MKHSGICVWLVLSLLSWEAFSQPHKNLDLIGQLSYPLDTGISRSVILNDIWGYVDDSGREYALVGTLSGTSIVDLQDPTNPQEIHFVPGDTSIWRDIKTYENYAFVSNERGGGLAIIDLSGLPNSIQFKDTVYITDSLILLDTLISMDTLDNGSIQNDTTISIDTLIQRVTTAHNLYQDQGTLYMVGLNQFRGGMMMLDLTEDPWNPRINGNYSERYVHDVYVREGIAYTAEISSRQFGVVDVTDPQSPLVLGLRSYPGAFTHNTWLNDASTVCFTTDERQGASIIAWDIQDPENIEELDRIRSSLSKGAATPHNVHVLNDFLITSYYHDGVQIVDANRPTNLVEIGYFDTHPDSLGGFKGNWGAYPFLPSGLVLASDRSEGLFVLRPNYVRAAYIEGHVRDGLSRQALRNSLLSSPDIPSLSNSSDEEGFFSTGLTDTGLVEIVISHPGYISDTLELQLIAGEVAELDVILFPEQSNILALNVVDSQDNSPIEEAQVFLNAPELNLELNLLTDSLGAYLDTLIAGTYEVFVGKWGYRTQKIDIDLLDQIPDNPTIKLERGFYDDFALDFNWQSTGKAFEGRWERAIPNVTTLGEVILNPNSDSEGDLDNFAYVTGNQGIVFNDDDVDGQATLLRSPIMDLSSLQNPEIFFSYWLTAIEAGFEFTPSTDSLEVFIHNTSDSVRVLQFGGPYTNSWNRTSFFPAQFMELSDSMWVSFSIGDSDPGDFIEAGIDYFEVLEGEAVSRKGSLSSRITLFPNPVKDVLQVQFSEASTFQWSLFDLQGNRITQGKNIQAKTSFSLHIPGPTGLYFLHIQRENYPVFWKKIYKKP